MKIFLGADHGGYDLKEKVKESLVNDKYEVVDFGAKEKMAEDDYVDYGSVVAEEIGYEDGALGILFCRNGVGMCIVANRFPAVRCVLGFDEKQVVRAKNDDDVNCLALPSDYIDFDKAMTLIKAFLDSSFSGDDKYVRRLDKLNLISSGGCCGGGCGGCQC